MSAEKKARPRPSYKYEEGVGLGLVWAGPMSKQVGIRAVGLPKSLAQWFFSLTALTVSSYRLLQCKAILDLQH